jgi:hypothetical protein
MTTLNIMDLIATLGIYNIRKTEVSLTILSLMMPSTAKFQPSALTILSMTILSIMLY